METGVAIIKVVKYGNNNNSVIECVAIVKTTKKTDSLYKFEAEGRVYVRS